MADEAVAEKIQTPEEQAAFIRHVQHLREMHDLADVARAEQERDEWRAFVTTFDEKARDHLALFSSLPCGGGGKHRELH